MAKPKMETIATRYESVVKVSATEVASHLSIIVRKSYQPVYCFQLTLREQLLVVILLLMPYQLKPYQLVEMKLTLP